MKIAVSCGGTGGHVIPGLTLAGELKRRSNDVTLWLAGKGIECESVGSWDGPVVTTHVEGLSTRSSLRSVLTFLRLGLTVIPCIRRMRKSRPEVLVAMGSYTSVGPVLAAKCLGVPVVLHEANVVPGRAIRLLSRFATVLALSFEKTLESFPGRNCSVTGFPIRRELLSSEAERLLPEGPFTVLVMGGSQGAHALNEIVPEAICGIAGEAKLQVVHLAGASDEHAVRAKYQEAGVTSSVFSFLADMSAAYVTADLAICRSGAATCAELTATGLPALLVPYPAAVNDHQAANARLLQETGQADFVREEAMPVEWLADYLKDIASDAERLKRMRSAASAGRTDGLTSLADLVENAAK